MSAEDLLQTVALLTANPKEAETVSGLLADKGWTCLLSQDRSSLEGVLFSQDCRGVILGLSTLVHLDPADREFIVALEPAYPVARLRLDGQGGVIVASAVAGLESTLETFLNVCSSWPRRRLRSSERNRCFLHGEMLGAGGHSERIFTVDLSESGAFVHADGEWSVGLEVTLRFPLGADSVAVPGRIVRGVKWGESGQAPGVAVQFGDEAKARVRNLLREDRRNR